MSEKRREMCLFGHNWKMKQTDCVNSIHHLCSLMQSIVWIRCLYATDWASYLGSRNLPKLTMKYQTIITCFETQKERRETFGEWIARYFYCCRCFFSFTHLRIFNENKRSEVSMDSNKAASLQTKSSFFFFI